MRSIINQIQRTLSDNECANSTNCRKLREVTTFILNSLKV